MPKEILAIIPARGGSKGVPRKNIKYFHGLPLLAWSIVHARESKAITRIVVSTEDTEIAEIARRHGAEIVDRPAELADDHAATEPALQHVIDHLKQTENYNPDFVVLLQATSPIRHPGRIDSAVAQLEADELDSILSVSPLEHFVWRDTRPSATALYDYKKRPRRQDIREDDRLWIENGNIYVTRTETLRSKENRLGGRIGLFKMDAIEALEIDTPEDWTRCESAMATLNEWRNYLLPYPVELLVLDFDGTLTDNSVYTDSNGVESVQASRGDGYGISLLRKAGIPVMVMSTETNPVVAARCKKLQIEHVQSVEHKGEALAALMAGRGINADHAVFVGNDINDLPAFDVVGCPVAVSDAHDDLKARARLVLSKPGGKGAVRELCDWILADLETGKP